MISLTVESHLYSHHWTSGITLSLSDPFCYYSAMAHQGMFLPSPTEFEGNIGMALSVRPSDRHTFEISTYLQIKRRPNWWKYSLSHSPGLINFWSHITEFPSCPGLSLDEQFLRICRQTHNWVHMKLGMWTHYGTSAIFLHLVGGP